MRDKVMKFFIDLFFYNRIEHETASKILEKIGFHDIIDAVFTTAQVVQFKKNISKNLNTFVEYIVDNHIDEYDTSLAIKLLTIQFSIKNYSIPKKILKKINKQYIPRQEKFKNMYNFVLKLFYNEDKPFAYYKLPSLIIKVSDYYYDNYPQGFVINNKLLEHEEIFLNTDIIIQRSTLDNKVLKSTISSFIEVLKTTYNISVENLTKKEEKAIDEYIEHVTKITSYSSAMNSDINQDVQYLLIHQNR